MSTLIVDSMVDVRYNVTYMASFSFLFFPPGPAASLYKTPSSR